jgi:protein involved in polysaccharide export with SLBB domain
MRVSDLIRAGGSLDDAAYGGKAELTRSLVVDGEYRETDHMEIDLAGVIAKRPDADLELRPYDTLTVKELPQWSETESVTIEGEVRFAGTYPLRRGETLAAVLLRAGGLTDLAFAEGAAFTRETLREREQQQLDQLTQRLRRDLSVVALQRGQAGSALLAATGEDLLAKLQSAQAVGRLVIDLEAVVAGPPGGADDITLRGGDRLVIPRRSEEVTVIGEVQNSTSHHYEKRLARDSYIDQSGGLTSKADKKHIYVVRADGRVEAGTGGAWYQVGAGQRIRPGDTIVVPLDAERVPQLPLWTSITQILYNVAIAVAAVSSL